MHAYFNFGSEFLDLIQSPSVQPNRLSCIDSNLSVVVNGNTVTFLNLECQLPDTIDLNPDDGNVVKASFAKQTIQQSMQISELGAYCNLQGCCKVTNELAYAVDSRCNLFAVKPSTSTGANGQWSYSCVTSENIPFSGGFSAVTPVLDCNAATIHYLSKQLQWMDMAGSRTIRRSLALYNPTAVDTVTSDGAANGTLAVSEGRCLSIWDHRMKENGITIAHYCVILN
jgi:hypothetical protein